MANIERSALSLMYESVLANMEEVIWNEYSSPLQMMQYFNKETGISGKSFVNDLIITGTGYAADKPEGTPAQQDTIYEGPDKKYTPVVKSLMITVTKEAVTDNRWMNISELGREFMKSFKATKEREGALIFINGFSSQTAADDVALFATTHTQRPSGASAQNTLSTAADLSVTSAQLCLNDIADTENDRGILANIRAGRLLVPQELEWLAWEIFKSVGRSDTANRADNAFKMIDQYSGIEIHTVNWLTDPDAYFFLTKDNRDHGLKYKEWWPFNTYSDIEFSTGDIKQRADERYVFDVTKWQGSYGVPGAD
jgi:hypothetical protein